ncbi:MAG: hypothetical protein UY04_C0001G0015 [Parcubacteria group bacterium GW2011_GWA2_47_7]|nr:MAG: hypothetical protein UY04_C0001G0015 [Parcubacteria group bacterium GW2011_GWA2_47_7]
MISERLVGRLAFELREYHFNRPLRPSLYAPNQLIGDDGLMGQFVFTDAWACIVAHIIQTVQLNAGDLRVRFPVEIPPQGLKDVFPFMKPEFSGACSPQRLTEILPGVIKDFLNWVEDFHSCHVEDMEDDRGKPPLKSR